MSEKDSEPNNSCGSSLTLHRYGTMINFTLPLMLSKWGVSCAWFFTCAGIPSVVSLSNYWSLPGC